MRARFTKPPACGFFISPEEPPAEECARAQDHRSCMDVRTVAELDPCYSSILKNKPYSLA